MAEKLYDVWARRNPNWEKRYEESIIKNFSDYGKGVTNLGDAKGKLFGAYPKLREFIFTALVAKTDFDFIALDKGLVTPRKAVDALMQTMEEYANWGFHFMEDKLIDNPNYFYRETAFLEVFLTFDASTTDSADDEPESLD